MAHTHVASRLLTTMVLLSPLPSAAQHPDAQRICNQGEQWSYTLPEGKTPHVVGEGILNVPGRERGWVVLVNVVTAAQLVDVDIQFAHDTACVYRLTRWVTPYSRLDIPLHDDPLFKLPAFPNGVAFSLTVWFQAFGSVHLVTRPAPPNMWRDETIVAGVRVR